MTVQDDSADAPADRILVVGEALIDVVRDRSGAVREHVGGSPANVALGLARLGRPTSLLTRFGQDEHGALVRTHLEASGVEIVAGSDSAPRTSTAIADIAENGSASYTFDLDWSLAAGESILHPVAVHTGSIGALLAPGGATVRDLLDAHRPTATISYDPNVRPILMGTVEQARAQVEELVSRSDVVKASDEDLAWLYPGRAPSAVAAEWLAAGPGVVFVTLGAGGALGTAASGEQHIASIPVQVVDTVGAGDSFMSGLLDALWTQGLLGADRRDALRAIDPDEVAWCLRRAASIAAITVSRPGADPPTRGELER